MLFLNATVVVDHSLETSQRDYIEIQVDNTRHYIAESNLDLMEDFYQIDEM